MKSLDKKSDVKKTKVKKTTNAKKESYFKQLRKEMKLVKWPSGKEVVKYTISTVTFCLIICIFFLLLYFLLTAVVGEV